MPSHSQLRAWYGQRAFNYADSARHKHVSAELKWLVLIFHIIQRHEAYRGRDCSWLVMRSNIAPHGIIWRSGWVCTAVLPRHQWILSPARCHGNSMTGYCRNVNSRVSECGYNQSFIMCGGYSLSSDVVADAHNASIRFEIKQKLSAGKKMQLYKYIFIFGSHVLWVPNTVLEKRSVWLLRDTPRELERLAPVTTPYSDARPALFAREKLENKTSKPDMASMCLSYNTLMIVLLQNPVLKRLVDLFQ